MFSKINNVTPSPVANGAQKSSIWPLSLSGSRSAFFLFSALIALSSHGAETVQNGATLAVQPAWLSNLEIGEKTSYDDNVFAVSGQGMPVQSSWVNDVSAAIGIDLVPLLGASPSPNETLKVAYLVDHAFYGGLPSEDYTANRLNTAFSAKSSNVQFSFDNTYLYNDGNRLAETYALNQLSGSQANQNDKYRNSLAHAGPRDRRNQVQDQYTSFLQFDSQSLFFRPTSSLNLVDIDTRKFNTSAAPYKGYQDYVNRYDWNGGADLGLKLAPDWAIFVGYRDGIQYQEKFAESINSDQHYSSNHYQRALLGLEGKEKWLTLKLQAGPDFKDYNPNTPISDLKTTRFYGESSISASLPQSQTVTLTYKQWYSTSSTGLVPYEDTAVKLNYHWSSTANLGFDLGLKYLNHNYTLSDDTAGSAPSLRDDAVYGATGAIAYKLSAHLSSTLAYSFDDGQNLLSSLAAKYEPGYRSFHHSVTTVGLRYAF